jgi:hypothetical protein
MTRIEERKLRYPTRRIKLHTGEVVEEYVIPKADREKILRAFYPFSPKLRLDDIVYDLHEGKRFRVRRFRIVREDDQNWLVSPYYPRSGGTVIDWMPKDFKMGDIVVGEIKAPRKRKG